MKFLFLILAFISFLNASKIEIEILGSGGPEIDGRASASYVLWVDNEAKIIVDMGSGSMLRFEQSGGKLETLEAVVLTHLHIDHSVDLPSFIKAGYFSDRTENLDIIGPYGNNSFPSIDEYLEGLFGENGVYRYMNDVLSYNSDSFQITPIKIDSDTITTRKYAHIRLDFINVHHGSIPALAVAITVEGKRIVISGYTNNKDKHLEKLVKDADVFIAHHAIPQYGGKFAKTLHMTPKIIADVATTGQVKELVLSHRMRRTLRNEKESLEIIKKIYKGKVVFAEDRMRIEL